MLAEAHQPSRTALAGKILVVDDEQRILRFVVRGLQAEGFTVDSADNGPEGLHKALEGGYDLVILDLLMPGMDGVSLLQRLMARRPAQAVLVLSCLTATATKVRCLEAGAEDSWPSRSPSTSCWPGSGPGCGPPPAAPLPAWSPAPYGLT